MGEKSGEKAAAPAFAKLSAEPLFELYFAPLYPAPALANLAKLRATDANPANNPSILEHIQKGADVFAKLAPLALSLPAEQLKLDFSDASVHRLAALLGPEARERLLSAPKPSPDQPSLFSTFVMHGVLYVGECIVRNHGGTWLVRSPLWESRVSLVSKAGRAELSIFQWWLKALSDEEIELSRLSDRYRTHVEVPAFDAEGLRVFVPKERRLPRLSKVRYDLLYKHLRAHLPELRDLGEDFPSPERFAEYNFKWLDFEVLGEGRMLLVHGPSEALGVVLFWLSADGFVKQVVCAADAFPAHKIKVEGDKLIVLLSFEKQMRVHEMLWWGL